MVVQISRKKSGGNKKLGRNKESCRKYADSNRRLRNKERRLNKLFGAKSKIRRNNPNVVYEEVKHKKYPTLIVGLKRRSSKPQKEEL